MRHVWSAVCKSTSIDSENRTLTLSDVIEEITIRLPEGDVLPDATGQATLPFAMQLISVWARDNAEVAEPPGRMRVILKTPRDPQPNVTPEMDVPFEGFLVRTLIRINDVLWRGTGEYALCVELRESNQAWKRVAEIPFLVKVVLEEGRAPVSEKPRQKPKASTKKPAPKKKRR